LLKKFNALPEKLRAVILAPESSDVLKAIAKSNNITGDMNFKKLRRYTTLILAGIVPITMFRQTLEDELRIDEDNARKIAIEVRDKIFMRVKDELRKLHKLE